MKITLQNLQQIFTTTNHKILQCVADEINNISNKYSLTTVNRLAGFIAQCGHESANFRLNIENLNYSAKALRAVFGKYFPTDSIANTYARKPELIANKVYANRMGNGPESSGDGWRYRGRGYIQLTGKDNYTFFSQYINKTLSETLQYILTVQGSLESAAWFWDKNNLNKYCDNDDIVGMTKRINGGTNGLSHRTKLYKDIKALL